MADAKDLENGSASHNDLKPTETNGSVNHLRQMMTNNTISDEQFERLFLSPRTNVTGDLRKRFANPTPLAIMGFSVGLTPLSAELMGWRGAGEMGTIQGTVGASLSFGALLLILAGIGEFLVGNTFPMIVFMGYGCHFLTVSITFIPLFNAVSAYSTGSPYEGAQNQMMSPAFANSFGTSIRSSPLL